MTRTTFPASEFGCTCNRCAFDRDDDLEALKQRASYSLAMSLIFLAAVLGVLTAGFWNANRVQEVVAHERNV
ncbi:hypothetical protein GOL87_26785 [Sinorhizobium medicae]|nr:hypothetical protein [Sinorhizobium medicae]MDX0924566.1 hypothetical protein [Sinorhizobium medicae]MDX1026874.1 hypothetical protein [Sinorhizobium medicae]MDX1094898.1 hypothetical protein [Sinorhizobium medicae]MDX1138619.1 hypothetical protein [Sinorhizobium medicae]